MSPQVLLNLWWSNVASSDFCDRRGQISCLKLTTQFLSLSGTAPNNLCRVVRQLFNIVPVNMTEIGRSNSIGTPIQCCLDAVRAAVLSAVHFRRTRTDPPYFPIQRLSR